MLVDNANPTRWWIPPPGPDESLRSTLNRAAALYKCDPQQLWDSLNQNDPRPSGEIDNPSCAALHRMARALGTSAFNLRAHRESDSPWRVSAALRRSYCPHCWNEDISTGRPLMIRRSWNHVLRTRCPTHNFPLMYARNDWTTKDRQEACYIPILNQSDWDILDLIETFAIALEQSLFFGAPWPQSWYETPQAARSILILVNSSMTILKDFPPTNQVLPDGDFRCVLYGTRFRQRPLRRLSWEVFRSMPDPAERRAALWLTAWEFIPGLPLDLLPHGTSSYLRSGDKNFRKCCPDLLSPCRAATSRTTSRRRIKAIETETNMASERHTDVLKDMAISQVTKLGYPLEDVTQRLRISSHDLHAWLRERHRSRQDTLG